MQPFNFGNIDGFYDVGDQMNADLRRRAQEHFRRQAHAKAQLTTIAAFEAHRERMRANFLDAIGGLPEERYPLNARTTGKVEREKYVIEKIIFESQPGFPVTAALYVPRGISERTPAVVFAHGHADVGKAHPPYQKVCIDLANNGFIAFAIDPVGQGERSQYYSDGRRNVGPCVYEHTRAGRQMQLWGASLSRIMVWDIMRGIDYLETRPEVDAARIAMTGNSGGGTQTAQTMMVEPRLAAAIPGTFIMTLESYQKTGQPQDAEQIIANCMAVGPDHDDLLTAMAPKPVLVAACAYDFFPIEGAREAVRRARAIYELYGKGDNVGLAVAPSRHQYAPGLREACVNWLKVHFRGEAPDFVTADPAIEDEATLWASESGEVAIDFPQAPTVFGFNRSAVEQLFADGARRTAATAAELLDLAPVGERGGSIDPRVISDSYVEGYLTERLFFLSAPDIVVTAIVVHPRGAAVGDKLPATMLLATDGSGDMVRLKPLVRQLADSGQRVCIFDPRGIGGVAWRSLFYDSDDNDIVFTNEYKFGCDAMMLGTSTLAMRVFDVLRGYDYLVARGDCTTVNLHGIGAGAIWAYYAAIHEPGFGDLTFEEMLYSYRDLCLTEYYHQPLISFKQSARGILQGGDLCDQLHFLAPRAVRFIAPRNALAQTVDAATFEREFVQRAAAGGKLPKGWAPVLCMVLLHE